MKGPADKPKLLPTKEMHFEFALLKENLMHLKRKFSPNADNEGCPTLPVPSTPALDQLIEDYCMATGGTFAVTVTKTDSMIKVSFVLPPAALAVESQLDTLTSAMEETDDLADSSPSPGDTSMAFNPTCRIENDVFSNVDIPFDALRQRPNGSGITENGENLMWKCTICPGISNSVYNDECAGGCRTLRPFPRPLSGLVACSFVDTTSLEVAFSTLSSPSPPRIALRNLTVITRKCNCQFNLTPAQCSAVVETIIRAHDDPQHLAVIEMGVKALQSLCLNVDNVPVVISAGGLDLLYVVTEKYPSSLVAIAWQIVQQSVMCSADSDLPSPAIEGELITMLNEQPAGTAAMRNFCKNVLKEAVSAENEDLATTLETMAEVLSDTTVDGESVLTILLAYSLKDNHVPYLVEKQAVPKIVEVMCACASSAYIVEQGLVVMLKLVLNESGQASLFRSGGVEAIISAMHTHIENKPVCTNGCLLLGILSNQLQPTDGGNTDVLQVLSTSAKRSHIMECGGIAAITAAMVEHGDCREIAEQGCLALLAHSMENDSARVAVSSAGGVTAAIAAMRSHPDSPQVAKYGCAALVNLATNKELMLEIIAVVEDIVDCVLVILDRHTGNEAVVLLAIHIIWQMLAGNHDCLDTVKGFTDSDNYSGIALLVSAMRMNASNSGDVVAAACGVFGVLAVKEKFRSTILQTEVVPDILSALTLHYHTHDTAANACVVLRNLLIDATAGPLFVELGGIQTVVAAGNDHLDSAVVVEHACAVFANLSEHENTPRSVSVDPAVVAMILTAMRMNSTSAPVMHVCCRALANMTTNRTDALGVHTNCAVETVIAALTQHKGDIEIVQRCCRFINTLSYEGGRLDQIRGSEPLLQEVADLHSTDTVIVAQIEGILHKARQVVQ